MAAATARVTESPGLPIMSATLLCYCRAGFEPELAAELGERAALAGYPGYARASRGDGYVLFHAAEESSGLSAALPWQRLVFARQKLELIAELAQIDARDRITPVLQALEGLGQLRVVGLLAVADHRFHRQPGQHRLPAGQDQVCQSRPMRPLPSPKGWMNSNS